MLSTFARFERSLIRKRQREGIALAKAKGTAYRGRQPALIRRGLFSCGSKAATGAHRTKLAKEFGISRENLYRYIL
jgi:DNA invertase Pin-like site-specific DNA recombinase